MSEKMLQNSAKKVYLPMFGFSDSFNVSVAAALTMQRLFDMFGLFFLLLFSWLLSFGVIIVFLLIGNTHHQIIASQTQEHPSQKKKKMIFDLSGTIPHLSIPFPLFLTEPPFSRYSRLAKTPKQAEEYRRWLVTPPTVFSENEVSHMEGVSDEEEGGLLEGVGDGREFSLFGEKKDLWVLPKIRKKQHDLEEGREGKGGKGE